jgi:hypothetical protein
LVTAAKTHMLQSIVATVELGISFPRIPRELITKSRTLVSLCEEVYLDFSPKILETNPVILQETRVEHTKDSRNE